MNSSRHAVNIAFLDVGQGDTIVITCEVTKEAIVVDCVDAHIVIDYLREQGIRHLRGVVVTHLHADHYRGVPQLLDNCRQALGLECELLLHNQIVSKGRARNHLLEDSDGHSSASLGGDSAVISRVRTTALRNLKEWRDSHKMAYAPASLGAHRLPLEGALWSQIEVLHPYHADLDGLELSSLNDTSVVLKVHGPGASALLTGDLEFQGFRKLLESQVDLRSQVLKLPHHGGWNADPSHLLEAVRPDIAVISVGSDGERYKHPSADTFTRIRERAGSRLLCTQATSRCGSGEREAVLLGLRSKAKSPPVSPTGRPCAGSIVVELGSTARVLWPDHGIHSGLIRAHFPHHQCRLESPAPS